MLCPSCQQLARILLRPRWSPTLQKPHSPLHLSPLLREIQAEGPQPRDLNLRISILPDGEQIWDINLDHKSDSCHHPHRQTCCWERFLSHGTRCSNLFFSCCRPNNWESSCLGHYLSSTIYYNNYLWQPNASFFLSSLSSFSLICFIKTMSMNRTFRCTQCYSTILWAHSSCLISKIKRDSL